MDTHLGTIDLVLKRHIDAPVERVWQAWTECDMVRQWWGPKDYTAPVCEIDLRVGGRYLFGMRAPDSDGGQDYYSTGQYEMIEPARRLVYGDYFADSEGKIVSAEEMGMGEGFPRDPRTQVDLEPDGAGTLLTVTHPGWGPGEMAEQALQGGAEMLDKLVQVLQGVRGIQVTAEPNLPYLDTVAEYDAPRERVFDAYVNPELIGQWMGPAGLTTEVEQYDARSGGSWRLVQTDANGGTQILHGVFHNVTKDTRVVETFEWETSVPTGYAVLESSDFEKLADDRTRVRTRTVFPSVALRDAQVEDMASGLVESYDRLTALLAHEGSDACPLHRPSLDEASCSG